MNEKHELGTANTYVLRTQMIRFI